MSADMTKEWNDLIFGLSRLVKDTYDGESSQELVALIEARLDALPGVVQVKLDLEKIIRERDHEIGRLKRGRMHYGD